ncbi:MAG TPA: GntR family transcriptional regulator [Solirubrobacterales bacterium]
MSRRPGALGERQIAGPNTTAQHAVEGLRRALVSGELSPGDKVLQEELAASLGVSLAPVREALAILEQEGQVTYLPRRGYFVTELDVDDLREIYELRELLEERAVRRTLPLLDDDALERVALAARDCAEAVDGGDVAAELEANRRFHFALLDSPGQAHTLRLIQLLWDSTETYRAMYYNAPEARYEAIAAHDRILEAARAHDADRLVAELDEHRRKALAQLEETFGSPGAGNAEKSASRPGG